MSWDWKKALSVGDGPVASAGPARTDRSPSITWRSGLVGLATFGGDSVTLVAEADHDCPFCRGRGALAAASVCPVCNGKGKLHVTPPSVECAYCGGHGQMPPRSNMTCWVCKGKGLVTVWPPVQVCPDCQGRGKKPCESLYCPRCRGVGVVEQRFEI